MVSISKNRHLECILENVAFKDQVAGREALCFCVFNKGDSVWVVVFRVLNTSLGDISSGVPSFWEDYRSIFGSPKW